MTKLNIGAGYKRYDGYINLDGDVNCKPDIIINLDDTNLSLPFEENSVDSVKAHHILEHIGSGYFKLLQEIYRVCKPGAIIDIVVPHPRHEIFLNDATHVRPITVEGFRLFSKKFNQLEIEKGGASSTLGIMFNVDFEIVDYSYVYDPFYGEIIPKLSQMELMRLMREGLNTTLEIKIKLMVIKDL